jgi:hypothetical protein
MDSIVQQVEAWFAEHGRGLSQLFPSLRFHVMAASDPFQGQVAIQVDGPVAGGSISFWNKGDVDALALDKVNKKTHTFDDRVLTADDNVAFLLDSYFEKLLKLAHEARPGGR